MSYEKRELMVKIELEISDKEYEEITDEMERYNRTFDAKFDDVGDYIIHLLGVLERDV